MRNEIPIKIKRTCCEMRKNGISPREIYDTYFKNQFKNPQSYSAFRRTIYKWSEKSFPDDTTLECGTYDGFVAHDATVQVKADGSIVQAWIKQKASDLDPEEFIQAIKSTVVPYKHTHHNHVASNRMLEIPLFDMHWGVAFMDHYESTLNEILELIKSKRWDRIVIPFGQDFFHNDSIAVGMTTKGTPIEKVDMQRAVKEGQKFIYAIIDAALEPERANEVRVIYSAGNHDRSISWMFMQVLLERYGSDIVDDSLEYRKVISYGKNAIMITHGDSKKATAQNLAHIFPISFPEEFANANVREVHSGHLHHEAEADIYGVMVRRLSSGGKVDEWTNRQDFVGSHRRFMLFEWDLEKLKSIHYI
jgi:predicted phosphodiesterase